MTEVKKQPTTANLLIIYSALFIVNLIVCTQTCHNKALFYRRILDNPGYHCLYPIGLRLYAITCITVHGLIKGIYHGIYKLRTYVVVDSYAVVA